MLPLSLWLRLWVDGQVRTQEWLQCEPVGPRNPCFPTFYPPMQGLTPFSSPASGMFRVVVEEACSEGPVGPVGPVRPPRRALLPLFLTLQA